VGPFLTPIAAGVASAILGFAFRRFKRTKSDELESFPRYLERMLYYYVGRHVRGQIAAELTLKEYARLQLKSAATKTMIVPATPPVPLMVDKVFIPLLLRGPTSDTSGYHTLAEQQQARTVVLGDPGSGKSSLMKRVFRDACRRAKSDPRHSSLPVLFELRRLSQLGKKELEGLTHQRLFEQCTANLGDMAAFDAGHAVEYLKDGPGFLLLLDGLDEVPSYASTQVATAIAELSSHLSLSSPRSSLIISTRTQHYLTLQGHPFRETFRALSVRPFEIADVYKFLLRWPFEEEHRKEHITRLFSRIRQLPSLTEMCRNPLALSMFVARYEQTESAISPETRSEFYASLVEELLVNRRARSEQETVGRQRLRNARESILGEVCLGHLLSPEEAPNSLAEDRFLAVIEAAGYGGDDPHAMLSSLAVGTGLFSTEREGETYRFLHLTLCEFFAALEVVNAGPEGWQRIAARLRSSDSSETVQGGSWASRLGEVVAFACGLAPRSLRQEILGDLVGLGEQALLLRASIEAQSYDDPDLLIAIRQEADRLAGIGPDRWELDLDWFPRLRWLIAVLRDVATGADTGIGDAAARALPSPSAYLLRLIDAYGTADVLLATLAHDDADAAIAIAEESGRPELMDVIAGATDDFSVLLGVLARCDEGHLAWKQALVHAALYKREIADVLAISIEHTDADATPRARGWSDSRITRHSVYGHLLDDVLASPDSWHAADRSLLGAIARIRPPRPDTGLWDALVESPVVASIGCLFVLGLTVGWIEGKKEREGIVLASLLVLLAAVSLLLWIADWVKERARRRTRNPSLTVEVRLGVVSLELNPAEPNTKRGMTPASSRVGQSATDNVRLAWRKPVVEEVLNLAAFRFRGYNSADPANWEPSRALCLLTGVRQADVEGLRWRDGCAVRAPSPHAPRTAWCARSTSEPSRA
jgi:hypothetical protein